MRNIFLCRRRWHSFWLIFLFIIVACRILRRALPSDLFRWERERRCSVLLWLTRAQQRVAGIWIVDPVDAMMMMVDGRQIDDDDDDDDE